MVLCPSNITEIEKTLTLCAHLHVDLVHLAPFRLTHRARTSSTLLLSDSQLSAACTLADRAATRFGDQLRIAYPSAKTQRWQGPEDIVRCGGIKSKCTIMPNGDVTLCEVIGSEPRFVVGNARRSSLQDIWCSELCDRLTEIDERNAEEPCRSCEHLAVCGTGCFARSLAFSNNAWSVDPQCWKASIPGNPYGPGHA